MALAARPAMTHSAALLLCAALGCTPRPTVVYTRVNGPLSEDAFDAYALQGTTLRVATRGDPSAKAKASDIEVRSLPRESKTKLALQHGDSPTGTTAVKVSKIANTDLVSEIGVEVTDHRVEYINEAAGVVKTILGVVGFRGPPQELKLSALPFDVDLTAKLAESGVDKPEELDLVFDAVSVHVGALPPDAQPLSQLKLGRKSHQFVYSACRSATVRAKVNDGSQSFEVVAELKIADPNYVQVVGLPTKGKIKMHSECGVSVESEKAEVSDALAIVGALATQGKAIKDAIDAAKKEPAAQGGGGGH